MWLTSAVPEHSHKLDETGREDRRGRWWTSCPFLTTVTLEVTHAGWILGFPFFFWHLCSWICVLCLDVCVPESELFSCFWGLCYSVCVAEVCLDVSVPVCVLQSCVRGSCFGRRFGTPAVSSGLTYPSLSALIQQLSLFCLPKWKWKNCSSFHVPNTPPSPSGMRSAPSN